MNNSLLRWIAGYVDVHMHGMFPERFINMCVNNGIDLWDVRCDKEGFSFSITAADFMKIKDFARKSGIRVKITRKSGLPFFYAYKQEEEAAFYRCDSGVIPGLFYVIFYLGYWL